MNIRSSATKRTITASQKPIHSSSITSQARKKSSKVTANYALLTPAQRQFASQLRANISRKNTAIMGATNTSNIMARPDFLELLPLFVQKLLITDVFGTVAMRSRQQLIPYFKFMAENTKGETKAGDILSSPFVNRQGIDPNFSGRLIKNEDMGTTFTSLFAAYTPVLPGSVSLSVNDGGTVRKVIDDGNGTLKNTSGSVEGTIDYATGKVDLTNAPSGATGDFVKATYQYDNETVGPDANGNYGAKMGKGYLQLDEINLIAEAHELACYYSIYSAFASQEEYGASLGDMAKEAAFAEITAEINTKGFAALKQAASFKPSYNWDASPVTSGSVVPSDYLNMFKLKLEQAAASVYQATRLTQPNRLIVGTNVASYMSMINGFATETLTDNVGPYKAGKLNQFDVYVDPNYDPNEWVMCAKSNDIRRNSALFGEYMPLTSTDPIGLANASVQQGYATMYAMKVVNPDTVVGGKILGTF